MIFKELSKFNCKLSVIPNGLEKYMSFSSNKSIAFNDSMLFIVDLISWLKVSEKKLKRKVFILISILTVLRKNVSSLKDCGISEKEYQRSCDVWKSF